MMPSDHDAAPSEPQSESPADSDAVGVVVNGEPMRVPTEFRVTDLLARLGLASRPVAVEINRVVVPRRQLGHHTLVDGDQLEIVTLVGGG